jgi:curved DNA-binding protein CbpA
MNQVENLYNILEIKKDATQNEIRVAYKKLALQWHPDKNTENKFKKVYTKIMNFEIEPKSHYY